MTTVRLGQALLWTCKVPSQEATFRLGGLLTHGYDRGRQLVWASQLQAQWPHDAQTHCQAPSYTAAQAIFPWALPGLDGPQLLPGVDVTAGADFGRLEAFCLGWAVLESIHPKLPLRTQYLPSRLCQETENQTCIALSLICPRLLVCRASTSSIMYCSRFWN
ncbi:hypothetical protein GBA52_010477 [Prunus armeniaca]|nr:hypothetical protein GBA52_010477 [Prunus armeniaca]